MMLLRWENDNFTNTSIIYAKHMSSFHLNFFRITFSSVCNITSDINSVVGRFFLFILEGNAIWDGTRNSREEAWSSAQSICSGGITRRPEAKRSGVLEPTVDGHETRRIGKRRNRRFIWKYYDGVVASCYRCKVAAGFDMSPAWCRVARGRIAEDIWTGLQSCPCYPRVSCWDNINIVQSLCVCRRWRSIRAAGVEERNSKKGKVAIGANVHDTTSLRILADILGYRLKYLRGQSSRGKIGETLGEACIGGNPIERVGEKERGWRVVDARGENGTRGRWKG